MSSYADRLVEAHVELSEAEAEEGLVENAFNTACTEGDPPNRPVNVPSASFATSNTSFASSNAMSECFIESRCDTPITPELLRPYPRALP
ncbi:hypothetical protein QE152_g39085 [Popillia japonica]|uniref:Uncharacterized protein n=1 Tax=Popillia japonica TaxID=7064 RepID=A0AAW1HVH7_POPJA